MLPCVTEENPFLTTFIFAPMVRPSRTGRQAGIAFACALGAKVTACNAVKPLHSVYGMQDYAFNQKAYAEIATKLAGLSCSAGNVPEFMSAGTATLRALIHEYLFVSLYRACAESLASENASRLSAMRRSDKNIDDLLEELNGSFHRLQQSSIDEELFDVISGVETLSRKRTQDQHHT